MIDGIIRWALQNRLLVLAAAALLSAWGAYETVRMPVDVFPDLSAPTVTVIAEAHGMAPEEVEQLIAFPIEAAMNGAAGVRRVRSSVGIGIAVVWIEFDWGRDIHLARQVVSEKLQLVREALPPEIEPPVLAPVSSIMGEIMFVAMTSARQTPMEVRTAADWMVRRRLLAVPGVSQVVVIGGDDRQYQVILDPERLSAYRIPVAAVVAALESANENTSAGFYVESGQEYLIHALGRVVREEDIAEAVVEVRDGIPIVVGDLGRIEIGAALKRGEASFKASPAVVLGIQKQPGANTLDLTQRLDAELDRLQDSLPAGMEIHRHIFRQADFIQVAIDNVTSSLRDGAILVVFVVAFFLVSLRSTVITLLAIPLSLLAAVLAMKAFGATINTMTLGGMAIAVGALVDDAIIDVENVVRRLRENAALAPDRRRSVIDVVYAASREIRGAIVFATLIIMVVFLPLFFLSGVEGRLLQPLGFAYIVSLFASLVVALTVTPVLCALLLPRSRTVLAGDEPRTVGWIKRVYAPALEWSLGRWQPITAVAAVLLVIAVAGFVRAGRTFLPEFNEGTLTISAVTLPGTALAESDALGRHVEEILLAQPEVLATARRTGRAELDEHAQGVNASEIDVSLVAQERDKDEFLDDLRREFAAVPGMNIVIGQPISHRIDHMLSGTRASIAVKIFGDDLYELRRAAEAVRAVMADVAGIVDLAVEQQADIPFVTIRLDRPALARHGLSAATVAEAVETAFGGTTVSRVLEGQAAFDLTVRFEDAARETFDAIRQTLVATPSGALVPLHVLADVRKDLRPNTISRENVQRKIVVMGNAAGRDLGSIVAEIRERVAAEVSLAPGYHVEYGGQFESAESAAQALLLLGIAVVAGIFLLLFVAFGSWRDAALVMINLPLALIGGVAGVYSSGGVVSVASLIGFITLFGIAARNGIMLVSHIRHLVEAEGIVDGREAVRRGALERLAPILMTALAAGLALVPLALSGGEPGSEIQTPMAVVILFGLLSSTFLNMLVVPALYLRFGAAARPLAVAS
jgi:CzcA family heavy metal efflux pump